MHTECQRQMDLQNELVVAIRAALPPTRDAERALGAAEHSYEQVALTLVALRHEFRAADGETLDLRGRSRGYRRIVRTAYAEAGAECDGDCPIAKRLTAGVSYWVRKLLVEQYGEERLRELGVLPYGSFASVSSVAILDRGAYTDPAECLAMVVDALNRLATDPDFVPGADLLRSAARAFVLLRDKVRAEPKTSTEHAA